ncbi:MAG: OmpH family outer membrane protein [Myxococcota bacterium]|nr:OmpH family outer membrane protein [Myxococcota bacterium]
MFSRILSLLLLAVTFWAPAANASDFKLGVVDYGRAIQEIEEGKKAQARLDTMYAGEKAKLEQMEAEYNALVTEYQQKEPMISEEAKKQYEQRLYEMQINYQQAVAKADWEMQGAYYSAMEQLMTGLRATAETLGKEQGYDLILESSQGIVLYQSGTDMTDAVIARYNRDHPGQ